jgi:hypothetical protein
MPAIGFAAPILPGKTETDRANLQSVASGGARHADFVASRRRAGITREATWIQSTPMGDLAVVLIESDDPEAAMKTLATSGDPFDQWFRDSVQEVHGIDLAAGFPPPDQVMDFRA